MVSCALCMLADPAIGAREAQAKPLYVLDELDKLSEVVTDILEDGMNIWTEDVQPVEVPNGNMTADFDLHDGWSVYEDDIIPLDWEPQTDVHTHSADFSAVTRIATPLQESLFQEASRLVALLEEIGADKHSIRDLSKEAVVMLRIDARDAAFTRECPHGNTEMAPMPAGGATFSADARLVPLDYLESVLRAYGLDE